MNSAVRRRSIPLVTLILSVCGAIHATAWGAADIWTNGVGNLGGPIWFSNDEASIYPGNWSLAAAPTASDDAVFQLPYVPAPVWGSDAPVYAPYANGQFVILYQGAGDPLLTANGLVILGNYTLIGSAISHVGAAVVDPPLTLTSGGINVGAGFTGVIDNPLASDTGTITKTGAGTLVLEQTVYSNVVVQQGSLGGTFSVNGNLTNLATLNPGYSNAVGTITVAGNFQQAAGAALSIRLASPTAFDRLSIGGRANLKGLLNVSFVNGFLPSKGEEFDFLTATDGVSGKFSTVDAPKWDGLTLRAYYEKNEVMLKVVIATFGGLSGLTSNESSVGGNVDKVLFDPRETKLVNYLYERSFNQLPGDFDKISPSDLTSVYQLGAALGQQQSMNIQRRNDDIRSGSNGFSAAHLAINGDNPSYSGGFDTGVAGANGDDGKGMKETREVAPTENRWGVFLSGTGEWVNVDGTDNARGYDMENGGFDLGVDYRVTSNFAIGLLAGYTGTTSDLNDGGRVRVNGGTFGLYATTFAGGWYSDIAAVGGYSSYDSHRAALEGFARGDTDGGDINVLFGTGYDFKAGGFTFGPTGSFNYTYTGMNGFTERDSLAPLNIHGGQGESLRTAFGMKASYDCKVGTFVIRPEVRLAWQHEYGDSTYSIDSSFANGGGGTFGVAGPEIGRDSLLVGAGFAVQFTERCSAYLYYDGELARKNYESSSITGGIRFAF